jgi:60 kDa SS-A/Ro ribonucleoprotein
MGSPITGTRVGSTSKVRCVDVAALFAASVLRRNRSAEVLPFDTAVHRVTLNGRDSVVTNAEKLARNGGGTDCSCALRDLNQRNAKGDVVVFVSDYESWVDSGYGFGYRGTGLLTEWQEFKRRNRNAKLICIDLTPRDNSQVKEHEDILQVGGFSDAVFDVAASFIKYGHSKNHWVDVIENIDIGGNVIFNSEDEE